MDNAVVLYFSYCTSQARFTRSSSGCEMKTKRSESEANVFRAVKNISKLLHAPILHFIKHGRSSVMIESDAGTGWCYLNRK